MAFSACRASRRWAAVHTRNELRDLASNLWYGNTFVQCASILVWVTAVFGACSHFNYLTTSLCTVVTAHMTVFFIFKFYAESQAKKKTQNTPEFACASDAARLSCLGTQVR